MSVNSSNAEINCDFEILRHLGLADWETDGSVTRGEFIKIVVDIITDHDSQMYENYKSPFIDVDENTKYRNEIVAAHSYGLINGSGGSFRPNEEITYNEMIKILVMVLGYQLPAETKGGYPSGYIAQASVLGIRCYSAGKVTRSSCARVLLEALDAPVSEVIYTNGGNKLYTREGGNSLLYTALGIYKVDGVVSHNGLSGLSSDVDYGKNFAAIGNIGYVNEYEGIRDLLGYNVRAYIREVADHTDAVVYAYSRNNKVLNISAKEYINCVNREISYETASGSVRYETVPGNAPVVYNNKLVGTYTDADFDIKKGNIRLIDNDGDSAYDVVKIESYTEYFVLSATTDTYIVTDAYNNRRTLKFDFENDAEIIIENKNGVLMSYDDIGENTVLTVAASKDLSYIHCLLSNDSVSGYVNSISASNDERAILVDDVRYIVSNTMDSAAIAEIKTGAEAFFYFNVYGEIAGYSETVRSGEFAYIIGAASEGIFSNEAKFMVLLSNGEVVTLCAKNKYYIDGIKYENGEIPASMQTQQVVRLKMNAKMNITHIDTVASGLDGDYDSLESFGAMEDRTYWSRGVCTGGVVVPDSIVIFSVPVASENNKDERAFETMKRANLTAGKHRMQLFNAKKNSYIPQVMVVENAGSPTVSASAVTGLVSKLELTMNSDGEMVDRVHMLNSVGEAYYDFKNPGMVSSIGISEGDVIAYELNGKNQITAANIIVDYDKTNSQNSILRTDTDVANLTSPTRSYDATFRVRFGYAYAKEGNILTISDELVSDVSKSSVESFAASTSMIYKVELVRDEVVTSLIKFGEIKDYIHYEAANMAFAFFQSTAPKMIVVYE